MPLTRMYTSALLLAAAAVVISAAPQITVDKATFNGGTVAENSTVEAVFKITNSGTEPLHITNVRPDCGCTVTAYDSVIAPGKSGLIKPAVNLKGFRTGRMSRGVTVTSNAANTPSLRLMIEAHITAPVEASAGYLSLTSGAKETTLLWSAKSDLKVSGVFFKPYPNQGIEETPINLTYTFAATGEKREDGMKTYKLDIAHPGRISATLTGLFHIATNHPERQEVMINGQVN